MSERRKIWLFAALIMFVTSLPYLIGLQVEGGEFQFTGFVFGVEDGNSYIAKMLSGAAGAWLFRTPYTSQPQQGVAMYLPYLLLGKLADAPALHLQLVVLYHLFRIAAGTLAVLATYDFLAYFIKRRSLRWLGLSLAVLGGGLGWVVLLSGQDQLFGSLPLDFYSPETFGFLAFYGLPHLAMERALLLWALLAYLRRMTCPEQEHSLQKALRLGLLWLGAGLMQPLAAAIAGLVIALHLAYLFVESYLAGKKKAGWQMAWRSWQDLFLWTAGAGLLPAIFLVYNILAVLRDPFLRAWSDQNLIISPHPVHYLIAYGLVLPFTLLGMGITWKGIEERSSRVLLFLWVVAIPFLAYAPVNLQRRLPEASWVALVALAMLALEWLATKGQQNGGEVYRLSVKIGTVLLLLSFPSTLLLLAGGVRAVRHPGEPVFRPVDEVRAFEELGEQAAVGDVVLAAYGTGNALPAWAPVRVVIGHGPESANLAGLRPQVAQFFQPGTSDLERQAFLQAGQVSYVFWGPDERLLGSWDPRQASYLSPVVQNSDYFVFRVAPALRTTYNTSP